jgi:hypothetical protein
MWPPSQVNIECYPNRITPLQYAPQPVIAA